MDANTLAKMANGLCDNTLTSVLRCWNFANTSKRLIVCPAMNTAMWEHPVTKKHLDEIAEFGRIIVVPPVTKTLICGDIGMGAMAEVDIILQQLAELFPAP